MTSHQDHRGVGENLRRLRLASGLSQGQLAARLTEQGIPFRQQTILKIEKGRQPLRLYEATAIAHVLGMNIVTFASQLFQPPAPDGTSESSAAGTNPVAAANPPCAVATDHTSRGGAPEDARTSSVEPTPRPAKSIPAGTYAYRTVDRLTERARKPGDYTAAWDWVHFVGILNSLAAAGHDEAIKIAADEQATFRGIPLERDL